MNGIQRVAKTGPELRLDDPCVIFALRIESQPFRKHFPPQQKFAGAPCWARFCGPPWLSVLAIETGVGKAAATAAIEWLVGGPKLDNLHYRPKLVVAAGYGGGLRDDLKSGDVVLATEIVDAETGKSWPATWPGELLAGPWKPALHRGRLVTSPVLVATPDAKRALGSRYDAAIVDMETAPLARFCHEAGIPFGCVRVVIDEAASALSPRLVSLMAGGRASPWRLAVASATSPALIVELLRLARQSRRASENLGTALGELLTLTLPWARD
jgi:nucleoside phosphorylase